MSRLRQSGFTVLELVVVVSVVSILLVVALIWMHPKDFSAVNRNAQRTVDTAHLMMVVTKYEADHGSLPVGVTDQPQVIGSQPQELNICKSFSPAYIHDLPRDPVSGGEVDILSQTSTKTCADDNVYYSTGYTIQQSADGLVTIAAPDAEDGQKIESSRTF